jgi:PAS domain S-box-containing protein
MQPASGLRFSTLDASPRTRKIAYFVLIGSLVLALSGAIFGRQPLPHALAFVPLLIGFIIAAAFLTALVLFIDFSASRRPRFLLLGSAYALVGLFAIPYILTFPQLFAPTALFGANEQSAAYLWLAWHFGFPLLILAAYWRPDSSDLVASAVVPRTIGLAVAAGVCVSVAATIVVTVFAKSLPPVFLAALFTPVIANLLLPFIIALNVAALYAIYTHTRNDTALALWLFVAVTCSALDSCLIISTVRGSYGWYIGKLFMAGSATAVLAAYVTEIVHVQRYIRAATDQLQLYRLFGDVTNDIILFVDRSNMTVVDANAAALAAYGYARAELIGIPSALLHASADPLELEAIKRSGPDGALTYEGMHKRSNGAAFPVEVYARAVDFSGRSWIIKTIHDVSERRHAEAQLALAHEETLQANRELERHRAELAAAKYKLEEYSAALEGRVRVSEEKYALLMERSNSPILLLDRNGIILEANEAASRIIGRPLGEIVGHRNDEFVRVHSTKPFELRLAETFESGSIHLDNVAVNRLDGVEFNVSVTATRIRIGELDVLYTIWHDDTERAKLEEALRHAQRLDAMGQLTGGLAHDFNNLLGVIIGNLDIALARDTGSSKDFLDSALDAAERGAKLIQQLLAFARRQPLQPQNLLLNEQLPQTIELLRRTVGASILLEEHIEPETLPVLADPTQLEAAIVNLVVNARDAMADGGSIVIECRNSAIDEADVEGDDVVPGRYVAISVSDTGCGMTPEIAAKAFEPFFSTKGTHGTGLGLSQVFGFAKQSGGTVKLASTVGAGTRVNLYLPAADDDIVADEIASANGTLDSYRGSEAILLVDDNEQMRNIAALQMRSLGYDVTTADPLEALELLRSDERVDLLFTDVIMPGSMDGRELARLAREARPGLKILFTSGFTQAVLAPTIDFDFGGALLSKPYRISELARRLRAMLERT